METSTDRRKFTYLSTYFNLVIIERLAYRDQTSRPNAGKATNGRLCASRAMYIQEDAQTRTCPRKRGGQVQGMARDWAGSSPLEKCQQLDRGRGGRLGRCKRSTKTKDAREPSRARRVRRCRGTTEKIEPEHTPVGPWQLGRGSKTNPKRKHKRGHFNLPRQLLVPGTGHGARSSTNRPIAADRTWQTGARHHERSSLNTGARLVASRLKVKRTFEPGES